MHKLALAAALIALTALGACQKQKPETPSKTPHRTDFAPEEFGVGRKHTPDTSCNRDIDRLLDQIRICVNTRPSEECDQLRERNNKQMARLKNSVRCRR